MPRMDGFELLGELARDEKLCRHVVWVLTTSSRSEDKARAWQLPLAGYVLKQDLLDFARVLAEYLRINQFPPADGGREAARAG